MSTQTRDITVNERLIHPFKNWWQYLAVLVIAANVFNLIFWPSAFDSLKMTLLGTAWSGAHWITQSIGNGLVVQAIDKRLSWLDHPWRRALFGIFGLVIYSSTVFVIVQLTFIYLVNGGFPENLTHWLQLNIQLAIGISFSIALILTTVSFFRNWKHSSTEAERLRAEMMTYKYESLRNQVNPHFLFNSLNVLSELVHEEPDLAVRFIRQLSDIYRYVLDSREREVVPLQEELGFIQSFAALMETRFEDKFQVQLDIEPKGDERIVPMALQTLVENAAKHNRLSKNEPLVLRIFREGKHIIATNPHRPKQNADESPGTGLRNLKVRYEYLSEDGIEVGEQGEEFRVSLPILQESQSV